MAEGYILDYAISLRLTRSSGDTVRGAELGRGGRPRRAWAAAALGDQPIHLEALMATSRSGARPFMGQAPRPPLRSVGPLPSPFEGRAGHDHSFQVEGEGAAKATRKHCTLKHYNCALVPAPELAPIGPCRETVPLRSPNKTRKSRTL